MQSEQGLTVAGPPRDAKTAAERLSAKLRESNEKLCLAMQGAKILLWTWDADSGRLDFYGSLDSPFVLDHSGRYSLLRLCRHVHPDDRRRFLRAIRAHRTNAAVPCHCELRVKGGDEPWTWMDLRGSFTPQDEGRASRVLAGTLLDIHENKEMQQQLEDERLLFSSIISTLPQAVFWKDRELNYLGCNDAFARVAELASPEAVAGLTDYQLPMDRQAAEHYRRCDRRVIETGERIIDLEETVHRDGGETVTLLTSKAPLTNRRGETIGVVGIFSDITDRKNLETKLAQASRLESLGQLATGIAHEINTPMQFVSDNLHFLNENILQVESLIESLCKFIDGGCTAEDAEHLQKTFVQADGGESIREFGPAVHDCLEGVGRVMRIVRAMKQFAHPGNCKKVATDIHEAIEATLAVSRNRWKYIAGIDLRLCPNLPRVECQPAELSQVLLNLILNAVDAIAEKCPAPPQGVAGEGLKGTITVTTTLDGEEVLIEVTDTGCGMDDDVARRIFDPFFTTKEVGQGTGQGLALCYDIIVHRHQGSIRTRSTAGVGTTMSVRLPVRAAQEPLESEDPPPIAAPAMLTEADHACVR